MPKRIMDGESLWSSDMLAACSVEARREYPWLHPLADAYGSFEITNLRVIWHRVAAIRDDLTMEMVEQIISEYQEKGLLFTWNVNNKRFAHWTGSEKPGRLPPPTRRELEKRLAPDVPARPYSKYLNSHHIDTKQDDSYYCNAPLHSQKQAANAPLHRLKRDVTQELELDGDLELDREKGKEKSKPPSARAAKPSSPLAFDGKHLKLTEEKDRVLGEAFPRIDRQQFYLKMDSWLEANPRRRKKDYGRSLHTWMSKEREPQEHLNYEERDSREGKKYLEEAAKSGGR